MSSLEQLRKLREQAGVSRPELARMIDKSHTYVWNVEAGRVGLTARETIQRWAEAIGVEADEVYRAIDQVPHDIIDELIKSDIDTWVMIRKLARQFNEADEE